MTAQDLRPGLLDERGARKRAWALGCQFIDEPRGDEEPWRNGIGEAQQSGETCQQPKALVAKHPCTLLLLCHIANQVWRRGGCKALLGDC